MKVFFDTETTGKCDFRAGLEYDGQPRIVQMAALLTDDAGEELGMFSVTIQPDGWRIPEEAAAIHGITTEMASVSGVPIVRALGMLSSFCHQSDELIAHNIDFDHLVTMSEYYRAGKTARIASMARFCTMKAATDLCELPGNYGKYKWPKLSEAMSILLKKELIGAHDALADVRGCAELYFFLKKEGQL